MGHRTKGKHTSPEQGRDDGPIPRNVGQVLVLVCHHESGFCSSVLGGCGQASETVLGPVLLGRGKARSPPPGVAGG